MSTETSIYTDPDLRPWHPLTIYFYRWLYENDHAHGITGFGQVAQDVMRSETKLTAKQIERAKAEIGNKVMWFDEHTYWVRGRANHTCYTGTGTLQPKFTAGARNYVTGLSEPMQRAFRERYPEVMTGSTPKEQQSNGDVLPIDDQSDGEPLLPTVAVPVAVPVSVVKETPSSKPAVSTCPIRALLDFWNTEACKLGLPGVCTGAFSKTRKGNLRCRWLEWGKDDNERLRTFAKILLITAESPHLLGENDRGWKMTFDFLIANDTNWQKVLDGNYKAPKTQSQMLDEWEKEPSSQS